MLFSTELRGRGYQKTCQKTPSRAISADSTRSVKGIGGWQPLERFPEREGFKNYGRGHVAIRTRE